MQLQEQVCSLELSKRLKELGVKQESLFVWREVSYEKKYRVSLIDSYDDSMYEVEGWNIICSSFTVAELGEMLREKINGTHWETIGGMSWHGHIRGQAVLRCKMSKEALDIGFKQRERVILRESKNKECWWVKWDGIKSAYSYHKDYIESECDFVSDTEANTRAKMLIYLLENKLITL